MRFPVTSMTACLCASLASVAAAQSRPSAPASPPFGHELSITTGMGFTDRIDASASPRPYGGLANGVGLSYTFRPGAWTLTTRAQGSIASLQPRDDFAGSEHAYAGGLAFDAQRTVAQFGPVTMRAGLTLESWADALRHRYGDQSSTTSTFISAFGTAGPAVSLSMPLGGGTLSGLASIPLGGLVYQPYANARQEREPIRLTTAGPTSLRGLDFGLRYESSASRTFGIVAEYRFRGFDYTGGWHARSITNTTSIGIVTRFGRKGQ